MRAVAVIAPVLWASASIPAAADEQKHLVSWETGATFFTTGRTAVAGVGGGPGYRYRISDRLDCGGQLQWRGLAGNAVIVSATSRMHARRRWWQPAAGLAVRYPVTGTVRIVDTEQPRPSRAPPLSLEVELSPLRFVRNKWEVSALRVSAGAAIHGSRTGYAVSVSILEIGRWL